MKTRWMIPRDFEAINEIDETCIDKYCENNERNIVRRVIENNKGVVVGLLVYYTNILQKQIEIKTINVHVDYRREGYGTALVQQIKNLISENLKCTNIVVQVPETMLVCQLFFKSVGFKWFHTKDEHYYLFFTH